MKKLKKILIGIVLSIIFINSINGVKAISVGDKVKFNWASGDQKNSWINDYAVWNYYVDFQTGSNMGQRAKVYCIDPYRYNNSHNSILYVTDAINLKEYTRDNALYYGLAVILQNGAHNSNDEAWNIVKTDLAVRAYTFFMLYDLVPYYSGTSGKGAKLMRLGHDVANESAYANDVQNLLGVNLSRGQNYAQLSGNQNLIAETKDLLRQGIQGAIDFMKNRGLSADISVDVFHNSQSVKDNKNLQEHYFTFKINQSNNSKNGYVNLSRNDIVCNNCDKYGTSITKVEYLENNTWKELTNTTIDLVKIVDKNNSAQIRVTVNREIVDVDECGAALSINYTIPSPLSIELFMLKNTGGHQRYVGGLSVGSSTNGGSARKQYSVAIDCLTIPCETELSEPACSPDNEGIASVKAPTNIKKCIIGKQDDAYNPYQALGAGVNNEYCSTYCKEDYQKIELNRALNDLKCGSYFKLKAHIEGSQDCYRAGDSVNKSINHEQFISDIVDAQSNLVDSYTLYQKATTAMSKFEQLKAQVEKENTKDQETDYTIEGTFTGKEVDSTNLTNGTITVVDRNFDYLYQAKTIEELGKLIQADLDQANKDLDPVAVEGVYAEFRSTIAKYNACVTDWTKDFAFQQKVIWEYTEYTSTNYITNSLKGNTTLNDLVSEENRVLTPVGEKTTSEEVLACTGEVNNEYTTCSTGWEKPDDTFSNYTYTICDINGCRNVTQRLSTAKYVKQHSTASLDYESSNSFNQIAGSGPLSGAITSNGSLNSSFAPGIQTKPLEGLPLSLDSAGGGIFKLKIRDLGEFYDRDGEYGRLIDYGDVQEKNSVAYIRGVDEVWNGEYTCYYKNDCQIPECPDCDFECVTDDGGECKWRDCPDCDTTCVNCIFNLGQLQLNNKTVSTNNFNSAEREYGYNWNINTDLEELELIRDKADETIKEIEAANTTIYDNTGGKDSKLEFEITLTPDITNYIREYNDSVETAGGYGNDSLTCYNYQDEDNVVHQNMFCYSDFIDNLIEVAKSKGDKVYVKDTRAAVDNRATNGLLNNYDYWTPWTEKTDNPDVIGGPAWK